MFKNKVLLLIPILLFSFSITTYAKTVFLGSVAAGNMPSPLLASNTDYSDVWLALTVSGSGSVIWYSVSQDGTKTEIGRSNTPGSNIKAPGGANGFMLSGAAYAVEGYTTNTNGDYVLFETPNTENDPFSTPGWNDHMSKLNDILNKIPPAPNWESVAGTFRDTILPKLKEDLKEVLGTAPTPPAAPQRPTAPDFPGGLSDGGITAPTGENASGLSGSGFSLDDLKNGSPVISERSDPTGGFTINDPMGLLPTQEDFMENIPGNPPVVGITEPTFTEPIFTEPIFTEPTYSEPTFSEPTFTEPTIGQEPTFTEPTGDFDTAPTPTPGGGEGEPLIGDYDTPPIPGQEWNPPLPGE
jgi:hypothetical protein